jgi:hypothetical protein
MPDMNVRSASEALEERGFSVTHPKLGLGELADLPGHIRSDSLQASRDGAQISIDLTTFEENRHAIDAVAGISGRTTPAGERRIAFAHGPVTVLIYSSDEEAATAEAAMDALRL